MAYTRIAITTPTLIGVVIAILVYAMYGASLAYLLS